MPPVPGSRVRQLSQLARTLCCAPHLPPPPPFEPSIYVGSFSQFATMLSILAELLAVRGYSHERLDGSVTGDARQAAIDRFCRPGATTFAFLLSTRAGGVGINLTAADTVIIYDSDWNPQNDLQAMARSHRIGQTKRVKVFRLVTRGSYEAELVHSANLKLGLERAMNAHTQPAERGGEGEQGAEGGGAEGGGAEGGGAEGGGAEGRNGAKSAVGGYGPPRDRMAIERMLRCGAQEIALDDDSAFRQFSEADIEALLVSASTTSVLTASKEGSTFSKAAFVADGAQIDISDPDFWAKLLPGGVGSSSMGEAPDDADSAEHGRRRRRVREVEYLAGDDSDEEQDVHRRGVRRQARKHDSDFDAESSDDDEEHEDGGLGKRRGPSRPRARRAFDSDGEDEDATDAKLWGGAHAEGWRVHAKGGAHYIYVSAAVRDALCGSPGTVPGGG